MTLHDSEAIWASGRSLRSENNSTLFWQARKLWVWCHFPPHKSHWCNYRLMIMMLLTCRLMEIRLFPKLEENWCWVFLCLFFCISLQLQFTKDCKMLEEHCLESVTWKRLIISGQQHLKAPSQVRMQSIFVGSLQIQQVLDSWIAFQKVMIKCGFEAHLNIWENLVTIMINSVIISAIVGCVKLLFIIFAGLF